MLLKEENEEVLVAIQYPEKKDIPVKRYKKNLLRY
jgi:hypothetical protein